MSDSHSSPRAVTTAVRVRYADTDKMGVAYYANYFVWFEVGRGDWMRAQGTTYRELEERGLVLPVIAASCEYRRPLRYDDEAIVRTTAALKSPARLEFNYELVRSEDGELAATGRTVHAVTDGRGRVLRLPPDIRSLFV